MGVKRKTLRNSQSLKRSFCQVFYRPSFGRGSSGFGEFDFIVLADQVIYLGESKWSKSSEHNKNGTLLLRDEQIRRHSLFIFYLKKWAFGEYANWGDFRAKEQAGLLPSTHSIPDEKSLLAKNTKNCLGYNPTTLLVSTCC